MRRGLPLTHACQTFKPQMNFTIRLCGQRRVYENEKNERELSELIFVFLVVFFDFISRLFSAEKNNVS